MKIKATYRRRMAWDEHDAEQWDAQTCTVFEDDRPMYSMLLGPDGEPLEYEYDPIGFDLRPRR